METIWYAAGNETTIWLFVTPEQARAHSAKLARKANLALYRDEDARESDFYLGAVYAENFPIIRQTKEGGICHV